MRRRERERTNGRDDLGGSEPLIASFFDLGQIGEGPVELAGEMADPQEALDPAE
jgi:hypothetical protein